MNLSAKTAGAALVLDDSPGDDPLTTHWIMLTWMAVGAGTMFRILGLGSQSLWFDEGYTAWMISHPLGEIVRLVKADTSPPLYYLLLHEWVIVFGQSERALRAFSALFSVAALILIVPLARRILKSPAAVTATTTIAALSFFSISFAQETRCYALMAFLCLSALYGLHKYLETSRRRWMALLIFSITAALYTHNIAAVYALALAPAWLVLPSRHSIWRRIRDGCIAAAFVAAMYLPWAAAVLHAQIKMVHDAFWVQPPSLHDINWVLAGMMGVRHFWAVDPVMSRVKIYGPILGDSEPLAVLILLGAIIVTCLSQRGERRRNSLGLAIYALLPPIAIAIYSCWTTPLLMDKVFLASSSLTPILLLMPTTLPGPRTRKIGMTLAGASMLLVVWSLWGYKIDSVKEDWRGAAKVVAELPPAHRLIVFVANDGQLPFDYYYPTPRPGETLTGVPADFFDRDPPRTMLRVLQPSDLNGLKAILQRGHYAEVVLILSHLGWSDPQGRIEALVRQTYSPMETAELHDIRIVRLVR